MMLWKCCTQYVRNFGKLSNGHRTGIGVFLPILKKGNDKECSSYHTIALISHASKIMLKILQASLQQYANWELPDVQVGLRKGRGTREQIANIHWIIEKTREFLKNVYFCFIDYAKAFDSDAGKDCGQEEKCNRGWNCLMSSLTPWTWIWTNSERQWRTRKPGILQSLGSQRIGHNLVSLQQQQLGVIMAKNNEQTTVNAKIFNSLIS